jgi:hypothetical protein
MIKKLTFLGNRQSGPKSAEKDNIITLQKAPSQTHEHRHEQIRRRVEDATLPVSTLDVEKSM